MCERLRALAFGRAPDLAFVRRYLNRPPCLTCLDVTCLAYASEQKVTVVPRDEVISDIGRIFSRSQERRRD